MSVPLKPGYVQIVSLSANDLKRFWKKVAIDPGGCWLWTGSKRKGYGQLRVGHKVFGAHCISWIIHNGSIPDGLCVCHDCPGGDNRACLNPEHLWLGTKKDNSIDAVEKGRHARVRLIGELNPSAKLTESEVNLIRQLSQNGVMQKSLCRQFGVAKSTICRIVNGLAFNPEQPVRRR